MTAAAGERLAAYAEELAKCAFCHDQCMSATAEVVTSGRQDLVVSRVAALVRRLAAGSVPWTPDVAVQLFGGLNQGLQADYCAYPGRAHRIEPYLRAARAAAVDRGMAPAAVTAVAGNVRETGNVLGVPERLPEPRPARAGGPTLIHDAAGRAHGADGLAAARVLLGDPGEIAVGSAGLVELDLGLRELGRRSAREAADRLAAATGGVLVSPDPVLVQAIRAHWPRLGLAVRRPVLTLVEYLAGDIPALGLRAPVVSRAVFHDPAALARGLGVTEEPRRLLRAVPGLRLVEAARSGELATDDGPYAGHPFPGLARAIAARRAEELRMTGAELVVTASPWSLRNLGEPLGDIPIVDIAEVVAAAGGMEPPTWKG